MTSTGENPVQNGAKIGEDAPYFMCLPNGSSTGTEDDAPDATNRSGSKSPSGSVRRLSTSSACTGEISGAGSSVPAVLDPSSNGGGVAAHPDPVDGGQLGASAEADSHGSGVTRAGSDAGGVPVLPRDTSQQSSALGPTTCAQRGITKPKQYTDGTVWWCMVSTTVPEEPTTVDEAFNDQKWVSVMDAEHQALLRNKTWHLVPCPKGKNVIRCK